MAAKKCLICNSPFRGRVDAKTCSPRCRKRLQQLRFSLAHDELPTNKPGGWRKAASLFIIGLFGVLGIFMASGAPQRVQALTASNYLNFQGRLLNAGGAVVPDGNYNIDFRLYNTSNGTLSGTGGSVGACTGACLWEETHLVSASQGVSVTNGYYSVNLGSITSFPSTINWDQQLYITMNVTTNGTTSCTPASACTWDGEMQNGGTDIALTSVPLAFKANRLAVAGTNEQILQFANSTFGHATTINLQDPGATTANVCYETSGGAVNHTCAAATGGSGYIQNQAASPQTANFYIQSAATNSVVANLQAASGQTANLLQATDSNGGILDQIDANGSLSAYSNSTFYALAIPTGFAAGTPTSGGSLTSGQIYYYEISATNANGESTASSSINKTPTSPNLTVPLTWNKVNGATGYKIYRNTSNSFTSGSLLLTTITNGTTTSYNDTGTSTTTGAPTNSTAGNPLSVYNQNGTQSFYVNAFGNLITANGIEAAGTIGIGNGPGRSSLQGALFVAGNASSVGAIIRGATSQTADLQQFLNVNGATYSKTDANGNTTFYGTNNTFSNLAAPTISSVITSTSGGTLAANTYYYEVTAVNSQGETVGSPSSNVTTTGTTSSNAVTWPIINGATSYKIYRNTTNDFTTGSQLLTTVTANNANCPSSCSYTDTGSATSAGLPPTAPTGTGLTLQGWSGQTANLLTLQNSAGSNVLYSDASGNLTTTGAIVGVGVNFGSGTLQGSGPVSLDASGSSAINIGTSSYSGTIAIGTGSGSTSIGNSSGTLALQGSNWSITTAGAASLVSANIGSASTGNTNAANAFLAKSTGTIGTTVGSYLYPFEIQGSGGNNIRLQEALYRRVAGSDWRGTSYRLQYAVDNSFTDGSKAYVEIGTNDAVSGNGFIALGTAGSDRLSINSTGTVTIGTGSTGEATPDLLVLDKSTSDSQPTCTSGAIYYNGNTTNSSVAKNIWGCVNGTWYPLVNYASVTDDNTAHTTTWTVPAGVTAVTVLACGGGGGGASAGSAGGGGGGGGAFRVMTFKASMVGAAGASISYTVGAGGSAGNNGGATFFGSASIGSALIVAGGGGGANGVSAGAGGASGGGSAANAATTTPGSPHAFGTSASDATFAGNGVGGQAAYGGVGGSAGTVGGSAEYGGAGGGGAGNIVSGIPKASFAGGSSLYGGGGGGAGSPWNATNGGGNGQPGGTTNSYASGGGGAGGIDTGTTGGAGGTVSSTTEVCGGGGGGGGAAETSGTGGAGGNGFDGGGGGGGAMGFGGSGAGGNGGSGRIIIIAW